MLRIAFREVREEKVDRLRWWMGELSRRKTEVRETFLQESTRHEMAFLIRSKNGFILVYAMEVDDVEQAGRAFQASNLPIDLEHKKIMREITTGPVEAELLYECSVA